MNKRRVQVNPGLLGLSTISCKSAASFLMETRATTMREREEGGSWMRVGGVGSRCAVKSTRVSDHVTSSSRAIQKKKKKNLLTSFPPSSAAAAALILKSCWCSGLYKNHQRAFYRSTYSHACILYMMRQIWRVHWFSTLIDVWLGIIATLVDRASVSLSLVLLLRWCNMVLPISGDSVTSTWMREKWGVKTPNYLNWPPCQCQNIM